MPNSSRYPNRNQGRGSIPTGRKKHKKHKSQPHAKSPRKSKSKRTTSWRDKPLFPGGITTQGQFDASRRSAVDQEFAPQEAEIQSAEKQIPGWYDDYLKKLQGLQTQTTQQYQGLQTQASSLAEAVHSGTPEAQAATESRNNIVKAIQGALLQQQGAATTRNTEMAGVATGARNAKLDEVRTAKSKLAKAKGDFAVDYTAKGKQQEFENAIVAKQFNLKVEDAKTDRIEANKKPKPETTYEKEFSKQASKHGFSPHDWAMLGPKGRAKRIQEADVRGGSQPKSLKRIEREENIKQAAKFGYSAEDWQALPPQKRSAIIRGAKPKKKTGGEFDFQTPGQRGKGAKQVAAWRNDPGFKKLVTGGTKRSAAAKRILASANAPDNPVLVSALLDAVYEKHLSRETARRLQKAGYKATEIARALGTPTFTEYRRNKRRPSRTKALLNPMD